MGNPNNSNTYLPGVIFIPSMLLITAITNSYPMQITFFVPPTGVNTYQAGQLIRLNIPKSYGMFQANGLTGKIISMGLTTMTLDIDSRLFDVFSIPSIGTTPASLSPAGSRNLEYSNNTNNIAFQPLNNIGN